MKAALPRWLTNTWIFKETLSVTVASLLLSLAVFIWRWQLLPPSVPLWYSRPWGEDQLAAPGWLLLLPTTTLVVFVADILIAVKVTGDNPTFAKVLLLTSSLVSFMSAVILVSIVFLVT